MKKLVKEWFENVVLVFTPIFHCLLAAGAALLLAVFPVMYVFSNFETLGILWLPLLFAWALFLSILTWQVYRIRELQVERFIYGDEVFFEAYPRMKKLEERKKKFKVWKKRLLSRMTANKLSMQ